MSVHWSNYRARPFHLSIKTVAGMREKAMITKPIFDRRVCGSRFRSSIRRPLDWSGQLPLSLSVIKCIDWPVLFPSDSRRRFGTWRLLLPSLRRFACLLAWALRYRPSMQSVCLHRLLLPLIIALVHLQIKEHGFFPRTLLPLYQILSSVSFEKIQLIRWRCCNFASNGFKLNCRSMSIFQDSRLAKSFLSSTFVKLRHKMCSFFPFIDFLLQFSSTA